MTRAVLCVDDDPDDRELIREAIFDLDPSLKIVFAENGKIALEYLSISSNDRPCLMIVDINMPIMDGKQVITEIKKHPEWSRIPIVVFSTSNHYADQHFCRQYGVEMVTKPESLKQISREAKRLLLHCAD
jgi:CheY-like chemotaxis protein